MQAAKSNRVKLGENLNPLEDATGVDYIDFSADIDNLITKVDKISDLYESGKIDAGALRYIPGISKNLKYLIRGRLIGSRRDVVTRLLCILTCKCWNLTLN